MKKLAITLALLFSSWGAVSHGTDDWPGWRGAKRDDISRETGLLKSWPAEGPKKLWVTNQAGLGYAGFAVVGERLYTLGLFDDKEFGLCLDTQTGKEIWRVQLGDQYENKWGDGPRNTPTVDGERIYFLAAKGDLVCSDLQGKPIWRASLTDMGGQIPVWGYAESPLIDGDRLICTPGGEQGAIVALDKKTGQKLWQTKELAQTAHYSSPIVMGEGANKIYVQLLVDNVVGIVPDTGAVKWKVEFPGRVAVIPTPIDAGGKVYVTAGYGAGSSLLEIQSDGTAKREWLSRSMSNHHGGVIWVDNHFYGHSDREGLACQNMDGKILWNAEKKYQKGAISFADGRFYYLEEGTGNVILLAATPEGFEEKGRFTLDPQTKQRKPDGRIWVHPVIANGKLFLRDQEYIVCFDVREGK